MRLVPVLSCLQHKNGGGGVLGNKNMESKPNVTNLNAVYLGSSSANDPSHQGVGYRQLHCPVVTIATAVWWNPP